MLNRPTSYTDCNEDLIVVWNHCEDLEIENKEFHEAISRLINLLDRYEINHQGINTEVINQKTYDCNTLDAKKAWNYSKYLEKQNRKLEKILDKLNDLLSAYGMLHPEIMNDPGII